MPSIRTGSGQITYDIADNNNSPAVSVQSGIAANDVLVLCINIATGTAINSWPSGFTAISAGAAVGNQVGGHMYVGTKTATGSESGNFTFSLAAFAKSWITSFTVTGVSTTLVTNDSKGGGSFTNTVSLPTNSISTGGTNNYVVYIGTAFGPGGSTETPSTFTPPTSFTTEATNSSTTTDPWAFMICDFTDPSNHSITYTGSITMSASDSFDALTGTLVFSPSGGDTLLSQICM